MPTEYTDSDITALGEQLIDQSTGEAIDTDDLAALCAFELRCKQDVARLMALRSQAKEHIAALVDGGGKDARYKVTTGINLRADDAKCLAENGFKDLVSIRESTSYGFLKTEYKKLQKLLPESAIEVDRLVAECTRSVEVEQA